MSAGLTASSSLLGAVSKYEAGEERSRLFGANQEVANRQAQSEQEAGAYNEQVVRMRGQALEGQQIASIGANNLQQGGTPAQVVAGSRMVNEMDALMTRNNALRRAWGFQVQGFSDALQSSFAQRSAESGAADSILSGGAKAYGEYEATGRWF